MLIGMRAKCTDGSAMREKIARVEHMELAYGNVYGVKDVSFELYKGEILALIGANGSGKTSTVECLEGLRKPTGGSIEILGYNPHQNRKKLYRKVGITLQEAEYPENIKVKELCKLFASFYENPANWRVLLEQFGLESKAGRKVGKLSGGEKQRLSILLAMLPRPQILILDELTTGLDPEVRRGMWESLDTIRGAGITILLVSHYMEEVEFLADRLVYLEKGKSVFVGTQNEFKEYVQNIIQNEKEILSLEEAYLLISPKTERFNLEGYV